MQESVKSWIWAFRKPHQVDRDEDNEDDEEFTEYQKEADRAWASLNAVFEDQELFSKEYLADMSEGSIERITSQALEWLRKVEWPAGEQDTGNLWISTAQTSKECSNQTLKFMKGKVWPFTRIIR